MILESEKKWYIRISNSEDDSDKVFNKSEIRNSLQVIGFQQTDWIIDHIYQIYQKNEQNPIQIKELTKQLQNLIEKPILKQKLKNLPLGYEIIRKKTNLIILLGGPSGTGKSSIASLLATRLGVTQVLSSDSIRHIMRNYIDAKENPVLFASTYETGKYIDDPELSDNKKTLKGFQIQAEIVQKQLEKVIQKYSERKENVIIEGVHITPFFMCKMYQKYPCIFPFTIIITNEKKHMERFAVRSKYMTLVKSYNKYIENFPNIRAIQKHFIKKSDINLIPKINNSNIDKSLETIHKTVMRYLKKLQKNEVQTKELSNALPFYDAFTKSIRNGLSEKYINEYIQQKQSKANKKEVMNSFLEQIDLNDYQTNEFKPVQPQFIRNNSNMIQKKVLLDEEFQKPLKNDFESNKNPNNSNRINQQQTYQETIFTDKNSFKSERIDNNLYQPHEIQKNFTQDSDNEEFIQKRKMSNVSDYYDQKTLKKVLSYENLISTENMENQNKINASGKYRNKTQEKTINFLNFNKVQKSKKQPLSLIIKEGQQKKDTSKKVNFKQIISLIQNKKLLSLSKNLENAHLSKIDKIIKHLNKKNQSNFNIFKTNQRFIIIDIPPDEIKNNNQILQMLNFREYLQNYEPNFSEFDDYSKESLQSDDFSDYHNQILDHSVGSQHSSLDVNITHIYNLNQTNDLVSVSEESFVIDEQEEFSDQTQSVDPTDKQDYSDNYSEGSRNSSQN